MPRARPLNPKKGEGARGGTADSVFASNRTHRTCTRCVVVVRMCQGGVPGVSLNGGGVKRHRGIGIDTKRPRRLRCGVEAGGDTRGSYRGRKTVISLKGRDGSVPLVAADGDGVTEMGADGVWWEWARRPMDGDRVWGRRGRRRNGSGMSISADGGAARRAFPLATQSVRGRRGPVRMPAGPWGRRVSFQRCALWGRMPLLEKGVRVGRERERERGGKGVTSRRRETAGEGETRGRVASGGMSSPQCPGVPSKGVILDSYSPLVRESESPVVRTSWTECRCVYTP